MCDDEIYKVTKNNLLYYIYVYLFKTIVLVAKKYLMLLQ